MIAVGLACELERQAARLAQLPHAARLGVGAAGLEDRVDGAARRLVGGLHRRQVGVGLHVVRGQEQVLDLGQLGGRPVRPRALGVDQQRLEVRRVGRVRRDDVGVQEPGRRGSRPRAPRPVVQRGLELRPRPRRRSRPCCTAARSCPSPRTRPASPSRRRRPTAARRRRRRPWRAGRTAARTAAARSTSAPTPSRCRSSGRGRAARRACR